MNLRIITFLRNEGNIGQRLQAFALQQFLWKFFNEKALIYDVRNSIELRTKSNYKKIIFDFDKNLWTKRINSLEDIKNDNVDYFILGSDQIFNPVLYCNDNIIRDYYTLPFIDINKKVPYASSSILLLSRNICTKSISFREEIRKNELNDFCYKSTNNNINRNIDPVLLFDKEFYLKYSTFNKKVLFSDYNNLYYNQLDNKEQIENLLYMLNMCNGVIYTQSYHMFILSILFNKRIDLNFKNLGKDKRVTNLIEFLNIEYTNDFVIQNYPQVMSRIKQERKNTEKYFMENLYGIR